MLLKLDFSSSEPIFKQMRNGIVQAIADGKLTPGERLPTIRALALESGVNMMTVNKAYDLLKQEGYIITERRLGAVVEVSPRQGAMPSGSIEALRLAAAEAKLAGVSEKDFLEKCRQLYGGSVE
jgi:DNA-binding transcriptional regulator YhcF (GntR family)